MAYNPDIPNAGDSISVSQGQIKENFQALASLFDGGVQNFVILPQQGSAPSTGAQELALYAKSSATTGTTELFMRRPSDGTETEFTASGSSWTRLPSGILLKWGTGTAIGNTTITFPGGSIPAFSSIFMVLAAPSAANISPTPTVSQLNYTVVVWQRSTTNFKIWGRQLTSNNDAIVPFTYIAIGV